MKPNIDEKIKNKIIAVISALIPDAKIYLFGSRARGTHSERSDIDIALDAGRELPIEDVDEIRRMFLNSNIMYTIEIVDLHQVSQAMHDAILKEGILWKS
jgi:predicted nucleotidyltransferase